MEFDGEKLHEKSDLRLLPHQTEGVNWMIERENCTRCSGGLLCDEVGLGKTIEVIGTMLMNPQATSLIVAPVNILSQWVEQLHQWAPHIRVLLFHGAKRPTSATEIWQASRCGQSAAVGEFAVDHKSPVISKLSPKYTRKGTLYAGRTLRGGKKRRRSADIGHALPPFAELRKDSSSFPEVKFISAYHDRKRRRRQDLYPPKHVQFTDDSVGDEKTNATLDTANDAATNTDPTPTKERPVVIITSYGMTVDRQHEKQKARLKQRGMLTPEMNYSTGSTLLHQIHWDRVILDECHVIRNYSTLRTRYVLKLQAATHWGLSATPIHNGLQDYYCLLKFLGLERWEIMEVYKSHAALQKYLNKKGRAELKGRTLDLNTDVVHGEDNPYITHQELILRRKKMDVFGKRKGWEKRKQQTRKHQPKTMPPCHVHQLSFEFDTTEERLFYRQLERASVLQIQDLAAGPGDQPVALYEQYMFEILLRLRQSSIHPALALAGYRRKFEGQLPRGLPQAWRGTPTKIRLLSKLMRAHRTEKTIVFCEFKEEMPYLQRELASVGITSACYDGSLSLRQRQELVDALQWDHAGLNAVCGLLSGGESGNLPYEILDLILSYVSYSVLLVQINSGNAGLNLQVCSRVYFTNPNWNPCIEAQAIGRAHRIGQKREVHVYKLVLHDTTEYPEGKGKLKTIDERVIEVQQEKRAVISDILNDESLAGTAELSGLPKNMGDLSVQELQQLILGEVAE